MTARRPTIRERLARVDWRAAEAALDELGYARIPAILTPTECTALVTLYGEDRRFRSRIDMERHRFGVGDYAYFALPLPPLVRELRAHAYRHLAPVANRWAERLGASTRFPPRLRDYLALCHAKGQTRPTPLLLRYGAGGYNCLHRDLYGALVFPMQMTCFLSRRGKDYTGGEFLLVEQRPRSQARAEAIAPAQGELLVFPVAERPVPGRRGTLRASMRHGVSRITRGSRYALGIIFHDAR
jgi:hypothetical protein